MSYPVRDCIALATLLEYVDETHKVAVDAIRLVQRFDRERDDKGRPAGICVSTARMNNLLLYKFVKIAYTTLRKRPKE